MKQQQMFALYSAYLLASFGATTATGLRQVLEGEISHDQVSRHLAGKKPTGADRWHPVKPFVRQVQAAAGGLSLDDSSEEKPSTEENDLVGWPYDHAKAALVNGSNFLTALYASQGVSLPVGFYLIAQTEKYRDPKTQTERRRSPVSKNELGRELSNQAGAKHSPFRFVGFATWFAAAETLVFIKRAPPRDFVCPVKTTRKVALSLADKQPGRYLRVETRVLEEHPPREVYLEGVDFPLVLVKQVFTNEDGSWGILSLVSSATTRSFADLTTTYQKRWQVECYPKSLKQNVSLEKSPTQTAPPQTHHFFAALCGSIKLERLKGKTKLKHFALKSKLYLHALHSAFSTLRALTPVQVTA